MLKQSLVLTSNLAGGINTGLHPTLLKDNELVELKNFYVYGDSIVMRAGSRALLTTLIDDATIIASYVNTVGEPNLVTFGRSVRVHTFNYTYAEIACRYGAAYVYENTKKPFFFQGQHCFYFIDRVDGILRRGTESYYEKAGIAPTATVPTVAAGTPGVGLMQPGTYTVAITGYNSTTGDESDYIESLPITLVINSTLEVSNLPTFAEPQVDKRRFYVTPIDQTNVYLYAGEMDVTSPYTAFQINLTQLELGEVLSTTNGVPPTGLKAGCIFENSMFVTDGRFLYKSKYGQFETFAIDIDVQPIFSEDGQECTLLYPWKNKIVAGKRGYLTAFSNTGSGDYIPTKFSDKYGVYSPHAMKHKDDILIWYDGENFLVSENFAPPKVISSIKIKKYLDRIADSDKDNLVAEIAPTLNSYVVIVPQTYQGVSSTVVLLYNYVENAWSVVELTPEPIFLVQALDGDKTGKLYAISASEPEIVRLFDENSTKDNVDGADENNITYSWKSKGYSASEIATFRTFLNSFGTLCTDYGITGTLSVYENGSDTPTLSIDAYMYNGEAWKAFELHTTRLSSGADFIQIGFTYTGSYIPGFKFTSFIVELLFGMGLKRQYKGIDV